MTNSPAALYGNSVAAHWRQRHCLMFTAFRMGQAAGGNKSSAHCNEFESFVWARPVCGIDFLSVHSRPHANGVGAQALPDPPSISVREYIHCLHPFTQLISWQHRFGNIFGCTLSKGHYALRSCQNGFSHRRCLFFVCVLSCHGTTKKDNTRAVPNPSHTTRQDNVVCVCIILHHMYNIRVHPYPVDQNVPTFVMTFQVISPISKDLTTVRKCLDLVTVIRKLTPEEMKTLTN